MIHFDIGRDLTDPDCLVATEVFGDRASLDRQEAPLGGVVMPTMTREVMVR